MPLTSARRLAVILLILGTTGCALLTRPTTQITFDRAAFALAYADMKAAYTVLLLRLRQGCAAKTLTAETCQQIEAIHEAILPLDREIRRAMAHPEMQIDWERVSDLLGLVTKLALVAV